MKPIHQTVFGYPHGNCYAACIASLLELPLEDMPVVPADADFNETWATWLAARGLARIVFSAPKEPGGWTPDGYCILVGTSPRRLMTEDGTLAKHAAIGLDGQPYHDPHPDGTFFLDGIVEYELIYRKDPAGIALPFIPGGV